MHKHAKYNLIAVVASGYMCWRREVCNEKNALCFSCFFVLFDMILTYTYFIFAITYLLLLLQLLTNHLRKKNHCYKYFKERF